MSQGGYRVGWTHAISDHFVVRDHCPERTSIRAAGTKREGRSWLLRRPAMEHLVCSNVRPPRWMNVGSVASDRRCRPRLQGDRGYPVQAPRLLRAAGVLGSLDSAPDTLSDQDAEGSTQTGWQPVLRGIPVAWSDDCVKEEETVVDEGLHRPDFTGISRSSPFTRPPRSP